MRACARLPVRAVCAHASQSEVFISETGSGWTAQSLVTMGSIHPPSQQRGRAPLSGIYTCTSVLGAAAIDGGSRTPSTAGDVTVSAFS